MHMIRCTIISRKKELVTFLTFLCFSFSGLQAEVVYLKNGDVILGRVTGQSKEMVTVATADGIQNIPKSRIQRISFNRQEEADFLSKMDETEKIKAIEEKNKQLLEIMARQAEVRNQSYKSDDENREKRTEEEKSFFSSEIAYLRKKKKEEIVLKSNLIPGLGQISRGDSIRGAVYMSIFGTSLAGAWYAAEEYAKAKQEYNQSNLAYILVFQNYYSLPLLMSMYYQNAAESRSNMDASIGLSVALAAGAMGVYLINQADARFIEPEVRVAANGSSADPNGIAGFIPLGGRFLQSRNLDPSRPEALALRKNLRSNTILTGDSRLLSFGLTVPVSGW